MVFFNVKLKTFVHFFLCYLGMMFLMSCDTSNDQVSKKSYLSLTLNDPEQSLNNDPTPTFNIEGNIHEDAIVTLHYGEDCDGNPVGTYSDDQPEDSSLITSDELDEDAVYDFRVKEIDLEDNVYCSKSLKYELDTIAPGVLSFSLGALTKEIGKETKPIFTVGDLEDGAQVVLHTQENCPVGSEVASSVNAESIKVEEDLTEGQYTFYVKHIDGAGNELCSDDAIDYEVDLAEPVALTLILDAGIQPVDQELFPTFDIGGSVEPEASVTLHGDANCAENEVTFSVDDSDESKITLTQELVEGVYTFYVNHIDEAGNGKCSIEALGYEVDISVDVLSVTLDGMTGSIGNSSPGFIVGGVLESDNIVTLHEGEDCSTAAVGSLGDSTTVIQLDTAIVEEREYNYYVRNQDSLGNVACSADSLMYKLDTSKPVSLALDFSVGIQGVDNESLPSFDISGSIEDKSTVILHGVANCLGSEVAFTVDNNDDDKRKITLVQNLADAVYNFSINHIDEAGNEICSAALAYELKTSTNSLSLKLEQATTALDKNISPKFIVEGVHDGNKVTLHEGVNCSTSVVGTLADSGDVIGLATDLVENREYSYYVKNEDTVGNVECSASPLLYTLDTVQPTSLTLSLDTPSKAVSSVLSPTFKLKSSDVVEIGGKVTLHTDAACTDGDSLVTSTMDSNKVLTLSEDLADSTDEYTFYVNHVDKAGNAICSSDPVNYKVDVTNPLELVISLASDITSVDNEPIPSFDITGTIEDKGSIALYEDANCAGDAVAFTVDDDDENKITLEQSLPENVYTFYINHVDEAGNETCSTTVLNYELKTSIDTLTLALGAGIGSVGKISPNFTVVGDVEAGNTVTLHEGVDCSGGAVGNLADGALYLTNMITDNRLYSYYIKNEDTLGNVECSTTALTYFLDTNKPATLTLSLATPSAAVSQDRNPTFKLEDSESIESEGKVTLHEGTSCAADSLIASTIDVESGVFTLVGDLGDSNAEYTFYVNHVDKAGNEQCSSVGVEYEVDLDEPEELTLALGAGIGDIDNETLPSFDITGTIEGKGSIALYGDANCAGDTLDFTVDKDDDNKITLEQSLTDSAYTFYINHVDEAGNETCSVNSLGYTLDTSVEALTLTLDGETNSVDRNDSPEFKVGGSIEVGNTVTLHEGFDCSMSAVGTLTDGDTVIQLDATIAVDGLYNYYVKNEDTLGNVECSTAVLTYSLDTEEPDLLTLSLATPSDVISEDRNPTFKLGDSESVVSEGQVTLHTAASCTADSLIASTIDLESNIFTLAEELYNNSAKYTFYVNHVDEAGNEICSVDSLEYTLDTSVEVLTLTLDEGTTSVDNKTSPQFKVGGNIEVGNTVTLHEGVDCSMSAVGTLGDSGSVIQLDAPIMLDQLYNYYVKNKDVLGNTECSTSVLTYYLDTEKPNSLILSLVTPSEIVSQDRSPAFKLGGSESIEAEGKVSLHTAIGCTTDSLVESTIDVESDVFTLVEDLDDSSAKYTFYVNHVDEAGNEECSSSGVEYEVDVTGPDALTLALGSGIELFDTQTRPSFDLTGTIEDEGAVALYGEMDCLGDEIAFSFNELKDKITVTGDLADNSYNFSVKNMDEVGNEQCSTPSVSYTVDTLDPVELDIVLGELISATDSEIFPTFKITGFEEEATVVLHNAANCLPGTAVASSTSTDGVLTLSTPLAQGAYNFYVNHIDQAGNEKCSTDSLEYTLDTSTEILSLALDGITGSIGNTSPNFKVQGTFQSENIVTLHEGSNCSSVPVGTLGDSGNIIELDTPIVVNKEYSYYVRNEDEVGNVECSSSALFYTLDTEKPIFLTLSLGAGMEVLSQNRKPTFQLGDVGGVESEAKVTLHTGEACTADSLVVSTTDIGTGLVSLTGDLDESSAEYTFYVNHVDEAGNEKCSGTGVNYEVDLDEPEELTLALGAGITGVDNETLPNFVLVGSIESEGVMALFKEGDCAGSAIAFTVGDVETELTVDTALGDSTYAFSVRHTDKVGNESCSTTSLAYTVDTSVDALSLTLNGVTGSVGNVSPNFNVLGTVETGNVVTLHEDADCSTSSVGSLGDSGSVIYLDTPITVNRSYSYYVKNQDVLGNAECSTTVLTYFLDTIKPASLALSLATPTEALSWVRSPTFKLDDSGNIESEGKVTLHTGASCSADSSVQSTIDIQSGVFTLVEDLDDSSADYTFYVNHVDKAGNEQCSSVGVEYEVDLDEPEELTLALGAGIAGLDNDILPSFVLTGSIEDEGVMALYKEADCAGSAIDFTVGDVETELTVDTALGDSTYAFSVRHTDKAGNETCSATSLAYTLDTEASVLTVGLASGVSSVNKEVRPVFHVDGSIESGDGITLHEGSDCSSSDLGTFNDSDRSITLSQDLSENVHTFYVNHIDGLGNEACSSSGFSYTVDNTAPTQLTLSLSSTEQSVSKNLKPTFELGNGESVEGEGKVTLHTAALCTTESLLASTMDENQVFTLSVDLDKASDDVDFDYTFYVKHIDEAGNWSCSANSVNYKLDVTDPAVLSLSYNTPASSPGKVLSPTFNVEGSIEPGAILSLHNNSSDCSAGHLNDYPGSSPIAVGIDLSNVDGSDSQSSFYLRHQDVAGNWSCSTTGLDYYLDINHPSALTLTLISASSPSNNKSPEFTVSTLEDEGEVTFHTAPSCTEGSLIASSSNENNAFKLDDELEDGTYSFYANHIDAVGHQTCSQNALPYVLDLSAPSALTLFLASDIDSVDNNTSPSLEILGTIENTGTVSLYGEAGCAGSELAATLNSTKDQITLDGDLTDGNYSFSIQNVDEAGNEICSAAISYRVDTVHPHELSIQLDELLTATDNDTSPTFKILESFEGVESISLYSASTCAVGDTISSTTSADGVITLDNVLNEGDHIFYVKHEDEAGNETCSTTFLAYTLDTEASVLTVGLASGVSSVNKEVQPIFYVNESVESGDGVTLHEGSDCSSSNLGTFDDSDKSITLSQDLSESVHTFYVNHIDGLGNEACSSSGFSYTVDNTAPTQLTLSLSSTEQSVSKNLKPTFELGNGESVEGEGEVTLHTAALCTTESLLVSTMDENQVFTLSVDLDKASDDVDFDYTFYVKHIDEAGNWSCSANPVDYTLDITPPVKLSLDYSNPTSSPSKNASPVFSVEGNIEVEAIVSLHNHSECSSAKFSNVTWNGSLATVGVSSVVNGGDYLIYLKHQDAAGNSSCSQVGLPYILDTTPPSPLTLTLFSDPFPTNEQLPEFTVSTLEDGGEVTLHTDSSCSVSSSVTFASDANDVLKLNDPLTSSGSHSFYANHIDAAGNEICSAPLTYDLDLSFPDSLTLTLTLGLNPVDTNTSPSLDIEGNIEATGAVNLYGEANCAGSELSASLNSTKDQITLDGDLTDGNYSFSIGNVDEAGNEICSAAISYRVDTMYPQELSIQLNELLTATDNDTSPTFKILESFEGVEWISLHSDSTCAEGDTISSTTSADGVISLDSPLTEDSYTFYVNHMDEAGNETCSTTPEPYTLDITVDVLSLSLSGVESVGNTSPKFKVVESVESGNIVTLHEGSDCSSEVLGTLGSGVTVIELTSSIATDGPYNYYVKNKDSVGNIECSIAPLMYTLDTLKPSPLVLSLNTPSSAISKILSPTFKLDDNDSIDPNGTVSLHKDNTCSSESLVSSTVDASKVFTLTTDLDNSSLNYTFYVNHIDEAGNQQCSASGVSYEVDVDVPEELTLALGLEMEPIDNNGSPNFNLSGDIESVSAITVYKEMDCTGGEVTFTVNDVQDEITLTSSLEDGSYSFSIKHKDQAENEICSATSVTYKLDTQVDAFTLSLPSEVSSTNQERKPTFNIGGSFDSGDVVTLHDSSTCSSANLGTFSDANMTIVPSQDLDETDHIFYVKRVDEAGNDICSSPGLSYTVDITAPSALSLSLNTPTKAISQSLQPTFQVGAGAIENEVTLHDLAGCSAGSLVPTVFDSTSKIFTLNSSLSSASGNYSFYVNHIDLAGNETCSAGLAYEVDLTSPATLTLALNSTLAGVDNEDSPSFDIDGTIDGGDTVSLYGEADCAGDALSTTLSAAKDEIFVSSGLDDATYNFSILNVDEAGNSSCSIGVNYILDTMAPIALTIELGALIDSIDKNISPTFKITGPLEGVDLVDLHRASGCEVESKLLSTTSVDGIMSLTTSLTEDVYTFYVNHLDAAGNNTCSSSGVGYTLDTSIDTLSLSLAGNINPLDKEESPKFTVGGGTIEDNSAVTLHEGLGCSSAAVGTLAAGTTEIELNAPLAANEEYTYYVRNEDAAGNNVCSSVALSYTLDTTAPAVLTLALKTVGETVSQELKPELKLVNGEDVEDEGEVTLHGATDCTTNSLLVSTMDENQVFTLSVDLVGASVGTDVDYTFYVKHVDEVGNSSCSSIPVSYRVDLTAPAVLSLGYNTPVSSPGKVLSPTFNVEGSIEPGAILSLHNNSSDCSAGHLKDYPGSSPIVVGIDLSNPDGSDSQSSFYLRHQDVAGNWSCSTTGLDYYLDINHPSALTLTLISASSPSNNTSPEFTVDTLEDEGEVTFHTDTSCSEGTLIASSNTSNVFKFDNHLTDDTYDFYANHIDAAGNKTCSENALEYVLDTFADTLFLTLQSPVSSPSGDTTPQFTVLGIIETDATVSLHQSLASNTDCSGVGVGITGSFGNSSLFALSSLTEGDVEYFFRLKHVDSLGNSSCGPEFSYTLDTVPSILSLTLGDFKAQAIGNDPAPTFSVSGSEYGTSTATLYTDSACTGDAYGTVEGTPLSTISASLLALSPNTPYDFFVKQSDLFGNAGSCSTQSTPYTFSLGFNIAAGLKHTCVLMNDSDVQCWGDNTTGQLGNNTTTASNVPVPVGDTPLLTGVKKLDIGDSHSCALMNDSTVQCWGSGANGALGNNATSDELVPVSVIKTPGTPNPLLGGVTQISTGSKHTCALLSDRTVECWGAGADGQLGNTATSPVDSLLPVKVLADSSSSSSDLGEVVQISTGENHTCALMGDSQVKCWGLGSNGQLGDNTATSSNTPVDVLVDDGLGSTVVLAGVSQIYSGANHNCVVLKNSEVKCWGLGTSGQLGSDLTTAMTSNIAVTVLEGTDPTTPLTGVAQIHSGSEHSCALMSDKTVQCWGGNASGQLGNNTSASSNVPVVVLLADGTTALGEVTQIVTGALHSCATLSDNTVKCWGAGADGRLGQYDSVDNGLTALDVLTDASTSLDLSN